MTPGTTFDGTSPWVRVSARDEAEVRAALAEALEIEPDDLPSSISVRPTEKGA
jgi:hypothetical protein